MYLFGDKMYDGLNSFHIILGLLGVCVSKKVFCIIVIFKFSHSANVHKDKGCHILYLGMKSMR